jgi:hypothetical protein
VLYQVYISFLVFVVAYGDRDQLYRLGSVE